MSNSENSIEKQITIKAPVAKVWNALHADFPIREIGHGVGDLLLKNLADFCCKLHVSITSKQHELVGVVIDLIHKMYLSDHS